MYLTFPLPIFFPSLVSSYVHLIIMNEYKSNCTILFNVVSGNKSVLHYHHRHQQKETKHLPNIRSDLNRTFYKIDLVLGKHSFEDMVFLYIARDVPTLTGDIFIEDIRLGSSLIVQCLLNMYEALGQISSTL